MTELNKEKKEIPILEYTILAAVVIACLLFIYQIKTQDINLARSVLNGLASGRYGVEKYIDWENLKGLDIDVGANYSKFPTLVEKVGYKRAFIQNFAIGFKQVKGSFKSFTHWRVYSKDNRQIIVAADYAGHNKTLLFAISGKGKKRVTAIQWKQ
jgi:hypothetical protein